MNETNNFYGVDISDLSLKNTYNNDNETLNINDNETLNINDNETLNINDNETLYVNESSELIEHILYTQEDKIKMLNIEASLNINPFTYNYVANAIRFFFLGNDYIESYEQNKLSNLNSCNNIFNACLYDMFNFCYSLPQSNELWMDYQILNNSNQTGFFCYSTVYTNDIYGIKNNIEQIIDFSLIGGMYEVEKLVRNLLEILGLKNIFNFKTYEYSKLLKELNINELRESDYNKISFTEKTICFIKNFQPNENIKWNDFYDENKKYYNKIIIICQGKLIVSCGQKSQTVEKMRENFLKKKDFKKKCEFFHEERVLGELNSYLDLHFVKRCTGSINLKNLMDILISENLVRDFQKN
jgi:hypothetical protein